MGDKIGEKGGTGTGKRREGRSEQEIFPTENLLDDTTIEFLEIKNNSNVRIHDTIAVNVDEVDENEIIY